MRKHVVVVGAAGVALLGAWMTLPLHAARQSSREARATAAPAAPNAAMKRLPDGTPDIRGTWTRVGGGLNEANAPESELKAFGVLSEPQGFGQGPVAAGPSGEVAAARAAPWEGALWEAARQ